MNVSIVIPLYKSDEAILEKVIKTVKKQEYKGKVEIIKVDKGLGLAESMNYGIKRAKYEIIVTLHQDCIPSDKNWLRKLTLPLKNKSIIASVSDVELPCSEWKKFDLISRVLTLKELGILTPLMDEKGCAYKKKFLKKAGLFSEKDFRTAGEDFDMYIKLKKFGEIAYPRARILHIHRTDWKKRLKKEIQYANAFGALVRIYGRDLPYWKRGIIKATPLFGIAALLKFPIKKSTQLFLYYLLLIPVLHLIYIVGFWKGFLMKKQTI